MIVCRGIEVGKEPKNIFSGFEICGVWEKLLSQLPTAAGSIVAQVLEVGEHCAY
jgi:hypothetical protein